MKIFDQVFWNEDSDYSIIIEDDDRVAYAYLMYKNEIIGDVWLYNRSRPEKFIGWSTMAMPFMNPIEFIKNIDFDIPADKSDFSFQWLKNNSDQSLLEVIIFIKEEIIAKIKPGSKPGWSSNVKRNGPLAQILYNEQN